MAKLGRWTGETISAGPGTSWASPVGGTGTSEQRNDDSIYSWNSTTATLTLPSSDLADGYLICGRIEPISGNNRITVFGRFEQTSGTGNFTSQPDQGYGRNTSNDNAYINTWAFIDNPSASAEIQFQWRRDTDNTYSTVNSFSVDVIPLYYDDCAIYESASSSVAGTTTPAKVGSMTEVKGGTNFSLTSNEVTITHTTGKRYMVLGGGFGDVGSSSRTQRWVGLNINGTDSDEFKAYSYVRNSANSFMGMTFSGIIRTVSSDVDVYLYCYRGDGVANGQGGADVAGSETLAEGAYRLVLIELNDDTEVFRGSNFGDAQAINGTGTTTNIPIAANVNFNDTASFTKVDNDNVQVEQDMDALVMANFSGASTNVASATRGEVRMNFDVDGTQDSDVFCGDYIRGNQGTQDTFGWSSNPRGFLSLTSGEDIGAQATRTGQSHAFTLNSGWVSFHAINLDSMEGSSPPAPTKRYFIIS